MLRCVYNTYSPVDKKKKILTHQNHKLELTFFVIFNSSLTIFIEDNQSGAEVTKVQKIALYGST